jgi:hypothetical protein
MILNIIQIVQLYLTIPLEENDLFIYGLYIVFAIISTIGIVKDENIYRKKYYLGLYILTSLGITVNQIYQLVEHYNQLIAILYGMQIYITDSSVVYYYRFIKKFMLLEYIEINKEKSDIVIDNTRKETLETLEENL